MIQIYRTKFEPLSYNDALIAIRDTQPILESHRTIDQVVAELHGHAGTFIGRNGDIIYLIRIGESKSYINRLIDFNIARIKRTISKNVRQGQLVLIVSHRYNSCNCVLPNGKRINVDNNMLKKARNFSADEHAWVVMALLGREYS